MSVTVRQRPGIYSDYKTSSISWSQGKGKAVGIVASCDAETNKAFYITKLSDVDSCFGSSGNMYELCKLALLNGAMKVVAVSVGTQESKDYQAAFEVLENEKDIYVVISDSESITVHNYLKNSVLASSQNLKERIGIIACSSDADAETWADNFNSERLILIAQNPMDEESNSLSGNFIAAALAGLIASTSDPSYSFNSVQLNGIKKLSASLTEDDIDSYILSGITPFEVVLENAEIIRLVTSKNTTDGVQDNTFKDINTILIIDEVIPGLRSLLKSKISGAKNNSITRSSLITQTIIELEKYKEMELIDSYDYPTVTQSTDDPTVCTISVSFTILHALNQIIISADISI